MKFLCAELPSTAFDYHGYMGAPWNLSKAAAKRLVQNLKLGRTFLSDCGRYQVSVTDAGTAWHLSIKRRDREPIHDWRELQEIKNALIGPEHEAVELYPAESRLVDLANQYHLWALKDATQRFPFGFVERAIGDADAAALIGAKQRPREG